MSYDSTPLWQATLAPQTGEEAAHRRARERLVASYEALRKNSVILASRIVDIAPRLTIHDISHSDALWSYASLICGDDVPVTPLEAYFFGAVCLAHDLGLGLAAWPRGVRDSAPTEYRDTLATLLRIRNGHAPTNEEIESPPDDLVEQAEFRAAIALHAQQSRRLALATWRDEITGDTAHWLEDQEVRSAYGGLIGELSHSHWEGLSRLESQFGTQFGAPGWAPADWTVDPLKLACMLRVADAAHLDSSRAPLLARLAHPVPPDAELHWRAQGRLNQPRLRNGRLEYTAATPFGSGESAAWWTCRDLLLQLDHELAGVDALLADTGRKRFAALGVSGVELPSRLARLVPTQGWDPIDMNVHVGNVAALARMLGGQALYGEARHVPIRELIQNATDACRARRLLARPDAHYVPRVTVALQDSADGLYVEIEDNGLGMSTDLMSGPLLDFGGSYWVSDLARREQPGLLGLGFSPTGRYGIGFFSAFMYSDEVSVTSRPFRAGVNETHVLEFSGGLTARPLLRVAHAAEQLPDGGTRVSLLMTDTTLAGLVESLRNSIEVWDEPLPAVPPQDFVEALCATMDVDIWVRDSGQERRVVRADDWRDLSAEELIRRTDCLAIPWSLEDLRQSETVSRLRPIHEPDGTLVGRCALSVARSPEIAQPIGLPSMGLMTVGGLATSSNSSVIGVLPGDTRLANRLQVAVFASERALATWATEQAHLIGQGDHAPEIWDGWSLFVAATDVAALLGDPYQLPVAWTSQGRMSIEALCEWARTRDTIIIADEFGGDWQLHNFVDGSATMNDDVVVTGFRHVAFDLPEPLELAQMVPVQLGALRNRGIRATVGWHARAAIARAWNADPATLLPLPDASESQWFDEQGSPEFIGEQFNVVVRDDAPIVAMCFVLNRVR